MLCQWGMSNALHRILLSNGSIGRSDDLLCVSTEVLLILFGEILRIERCSIVNYDICLFDLRKVILEDGRGVV